MAAWRHKLPPRKSQFQRTEVQQRRPKKIKGFIRNVDYINALSFYKSKNVLCQFKLFGQNQKLNCIQCCSKNIFWSDTKSFGQYVNQFLGPAGGRGLVFSWYLWKLLKTLFWPLKVHYKKLASSKFQTMQANKQVDFFRQVKAVKKFAQIKIDKNFVKSK